MKIAKIQTELQPHQQRVVDRIKNQQGLVVAHDPGSGKTLASLAAAEEFGGNTQVVVPASLQQNYKKEIAKHVVDPGSTYNIRSLQGLTRSGASTPGNLLIVDEAHRLRDPGSKSRNVVTDSSAKKRLLLTGSPLYNRPYDLAGLVNLAAGHTVLPKDRAGFDAKYIGERVTKPGFIQRLRGVKPGSTAVLKDPEGLSDAMKKWVDYHENPRTSDFPTRRDTTVEVPFGEQQREVYDAVIGKAPSWVRSKVRSGLPPSKQESKQLNAFLNAARQVSVSPGSFISNNTAESSAEQSPKIQQAFMRLHSAIKKNPEHRAVVYSNYLDSGVTPYESMLKQHGISYGKFTGDMKPRDRNAMVQDYNSGKLKVLLLSSAGGEGLDLKGTRQIQILEPHWNKEKLEQVIARGVRYQSHSDLPEDQRDVEVEHYMSTLPEPGRLKKLFGAKRPGAVDEYLTQLSADKDLLNQQVREALRRGQDTYGMKTSMIPKQVFAEFVAALNKTDRTPGELDYDTDLLSRNRDGAGTSGMTNEQNKVALVERLVRLGATDVGKTPRLFMKKRSPEELAALQHGVTRAFRKVEAPLQRKLHLATAGMEPTKKKVLRSAGKALIENPAQLLLTAPIPVPGAGPAAVGVTRGMERLIDRFAPV